MKLRNLVLLFAFTCSMNAFAESQAAQAADQCIRNVVAIVGGGERDLMGHVASNCAKPYIHLMTTQECYRFAGWHPYREARESAYRDCDSYANSNLQRPASPRPAGSY